ncbi:efflux RND transporter permease subunit [Bacteroides ovatus]|jgi:hydrophobe/amphiphile efflux-1 (HAE1) family protein|uniref:Efflux RND transporter permease subunit n=2 Tax=Bacteroides TaxID=816 RepID=A0A5M5N8F7_BACOV|nr:MULTISPECIES: efflux RND transporter permease subunit [Bacteroidales]RGZ57578.1 hydrophobe/amphiphile efflux-1 family RND transporter [Parabacteroides distasonis]KAA3974762.1 efflux RND transporter permease subunit [Bacteroides ovatus]KAA4568965.1 efflux RND transporter permease subunit [Bacteroides ovatus]KAA4570895.1 efflux RND transporter permease subunit [Bacteroides ovatus]KAA4573684.1 efflux RND transporter permease subunit [Bacteroides ovatus]
MNLRFFIDRPVFSGVISVVIVLMGVIAMKALPVEQYPDIAPPTVNVFCTYPGANAETVQKAVIVPLEEAINGVEDMIYMTSTASNTGDASINIYFKQGANADMAAVNVQNRVNGALSQLPAEATKSGVMTEKQQNAELMTFALYSPDGRFDQTFLNNYVKINVEPRLKRIGGVGKAQLFGSNYSMRLWLRPDKMAQYGLIPDDISSVLAKQNIEAATGSFGANHPTANEYTMKYRGRLSTAEEFGELVIKSLPGGDVLRLKDVADVELGDEYYNYSTEVNGRPAATMLINQKAGSNASSTINEIHEVLDDLKRDLPQGAEFVVLTDTNKFLYASIKSVLRTLLEAILLVVIVVYVFLQDIKSTLIPSISIFVSIIGTFAVMSMIGFSINLLTLFALVLAIGTVVDDAIVVVEAVQAKFDEGYRSPVLAADDAMKGVSSAILTSTIIFMAVFIPVAMMGGTSGAFYAQFGITMAVAVGISAVNAFTLSPALCALFLKPYTDEYGNTKNNFAARFREAFNAIFDRLSHRYVRGVLYIIRRRWLLWGTIITSFGLLVLLVNITKTGLIPQEDTGTVMVSMNTKPGSSMAQTNEVMKQLNSRLDSIGEIEYSGAVAGFSFNGSGPSQAMYFMTLSDWGQRKGEGQSVDDVIGKIYAASSDVPDATVFAMSPPMVAGYGMGNGFELYLQDKTGGDAAAFKKEADKFVEALSRRPEIGEVYSSFATDYPQYWVDIDAAKCEQSGVSPSDVLSTLSGYYTGSYVSDFNRFSKLYHVTMQAPAEYRINTESLNLMYVRTSDGSMAPLSQFVRLTKTNGPSDLTRFNLFNAIAINGSPAPGYSSGQAIKAIGETAQEVLPATCSYEYGGLSREESKTTNNATMIFLLCMVLIYLILCALYESVFIPFAVLLSVPCGLMGSFLFAWLFGLENNIYMQTGLIMIIGLLAKTAILLTEYAGKRRAEGMTLAQAAYSAAKVRLRPILMTVLSMVFGLVPLMMAHGVGANGSRSLATGVIGGMIIGTLALLFLVPSLFIAFQYIQERVKHN